MILRGDEIAGDRHIVGFLEHAGFELLLAREKIDDVAYFAKSVVKKVLGQPAVLRSPFASHYQTLQLRARLWT